MMEESVLIPSHSGVMLSGLVRKPTGSGPFPAVVFVSGFGMDLHEYKNSNDEVSKRFVDAGFLTVQFNFSVVGLGRELSLDDRAKELIVVWEWMRSQPDIDNRRMDVHATSFGTLTVLQAMLKDIRSMIFVSGVYDKASTFRQEFIGRGATIHYDKDTELHRSSGKKTIVGPEFWSSLDRFEPFVFARNISTPICIIHGDQDKKIETSFVRKFYSAIGSKKKKLKIFKNGDHGIMDVPRAMREEFLREVVEWFRKTL